MASLRERIGARDIAITVVLSLLAVLLMYVNMQDGAIQGPVLAIPVFVVVTLPLLWRRAAPVAALVGVLGALLLHFALFGPLIRCGVVLPTIFVLCFSAAVELDRRHALIALGVGLAAVLAVCLTDHELGADITFFPVLALLTVAVWGTGGVVRSRGQIAAELRLRTAELREARDERVRLEVATDRTRVSGQLDELLQRRLAELARLADEAPHPTDSAVATATLVDIENQSRATLEEMRALVGVLRDCDAPTAPPPTLTHLQALLVNAKGAAAEFVVEGNPRVLPAQIELSVYRIVEHLLSALDDGAGVQVRVHFADDSLEIAVCGPPHRRPKAAIERARERVQLHHGTLQTTRRGGRSEAVATLPVLVGG
ncbi:MAG: hypothetical protein M3376_02655 [Actinomycetota bacterium]|nr:hypothetical protein [Actinomycetota bacterium]